MSFHNLLAVFKKAEKTPQIIKSNDAPTIDSSSDEFVDILIAKYSRGSVLLQQAGGYMTKEQRDSLKSKVISRKFA